jgi:hypothetical protein
MDKNNFPINYSTGKRHSDTQPNKHLSVWNELCSRLSNPRLSQQKDGPYWVPAVFKATHTRKAEDIESIHLLAIDSDDGMAREEHEAILKQLGVEAFAHTTYSHTPEKPKWRVVLPLARPIIPEELVQVFDYVNIAYGNRLDTCTKMPAQIFYLPAIKEGGSFESFHHPGRLLDPDEILAAHPAAPTEKVSRTTLTRAPASNTNDEDSWEYLDATTGEVFDIKKWAAKHPDFKLASAIREFAPDLLIDQPKDGKQHIRCINASVHTSNGTDKATFVTDGTTTTMRNRPSVAGFVYRCLHDHCRDSDRLFFIKALLVGGHLPLSVLTDPKFLSDVQKPKYVNIWTDDLLRGQRFLMLSGEERGTWCHLLAHLLDNGGNLPDDDKHIARRLGIEPDVWQGHRNALIDVGLLEVDGGNVSNRRAVQEYDKAADAFDGYRRRGRAGGSILK